MDRPVHTWFTNIKKWEIVYQVYFATLPNSSEWKFPEFRVLVDSAGKNPTQAQRVILNGKAYELKGLWDNSHQRRKDHPVP